MKKYNSLKNMTPEEKRKYKLEQRNYQFVYDYKQQKNQQQLHRIKEQSDRAFNL